MTCSDDAISFAVMSAKPEHNVALLLEQLAEMKAVVRLLQGENDELKRKMLELLYRIYKGMRSERRKVDPKQLRLFMDDLIAEAIEATVKEQEAEAPQEKRRSRRNGRRPLPKNLKHEREIFDLCDAEKQCTGCGETMAKIGEDVTELLDYVPASFLVREIVRPKYACRCKGCRGTVKSAALPPLPIEKGRPAPGLLAHVVTSKWADHLPLYRQSRIYARYGVDLHRSTLCDWTDAVADLLRPIVMAMWQRLRSGKYLQVDETTIRVLDVKPDKAHQAYLWAYGVPYGEVVFDFSLSRAGEHPSRMLAEYVGVVQCDGYVGYDAICEQATVVRHGCMAHVRRKFVEARTEQPEEATFALAAIQMLYRIERTIRDATPEERVRVRQLRSKEIFETLAGQLDVFAAKTVLPKSKFGEAVAYARSQLPLIENYLRVGELEIDNNSIENAIRPVALGRKNFLFCATPNGGDKAAVLFSLVTSCQRLDLDPWSYLRDVIGRVSTHPNARIDELTPLGWKQARDAQRD